MSNTSILFHHQLYHELFVSHLTLDSQTQLCYRRILITSWVLFGLCRYTFMDMVEFVLSSSRLRLFTYLNGRRLQYSRMEWLAVLLAHVHETGRAQSVQRSRRERTCVIDKRRYRVIVTKTTHIFNLTSEVYNMWNCVVAAIQWITFAECNQGMFSQPVQFLFLICYKKRMRVISFWYAT